jgi:hypothetical protein
VFLSCRLSKRIQVVLMTCLAFPTIAVANDVVALWLFDEPIDSGRGTVLKDSSGNGYHLDLGSGKIVDNAKFGHGLYCHAWVADFTARRLNIQGSPLNLGNWDWTVEWWQRRDGAVAKGYVDWVYLTYDNTRQTVDTQQKWELGFQADARFLGIGVWHHTRDWFNRPVRLNVLADKYDEVHRIALTHDVKPDFYAGNDPDFHHIAWVNDARAKRLYYFEDGEGPYFVKDGTSVTPGSQIHSIYGMMGMGALDEYPHSYDLYSDTGDIALYVGGENSIGPDPETGLGIDKIPKGYQFAPRPRDGQQARSVIDEMRITKAVLYREPFSPPPGFSRGHTGPWLELSDRQINFVAINRGENPSPQSLTMRSVGDGKPTRWKAHTNAGWIRFSPQEGVLGEEPVTLSVAVDTSDRWSRLYEAEIAIELAGAGSPKQTVAVSLNVQSSAETVWLFDEPQDAPHRYRLEDQTTNGFDLTLGPGGKLVQGRIGGALDPNGGRQGQAAIRRYVDPTHLNLGHFDWTWESWINFHEPADDGDILFMGREDIRIGPTYPFYRGVGHRCGLEIGASGNYLRFINSRSGIADLRIKTDAAVINGETDGWHHLAVVHDADAQQLKHWIDGRLQDSVAVPARLEAFFRTGENNLSLGKTMRGERSLNGYLDEVRISLGKKYQGDFQPPSSFVPPQGVIKLKAGPHLFIDDYFISNSSGLKRTTHKPEYPVEAPPGWDEFSKYVAYENMADAGVDCPNPKRRFLRTNFVHTQSKAAGFAGTVVSFAPTPDGPWVNYENNPVIPFIFEGEPGQIHAVIDAHPVIFDPATKQFVMIYKSNPLSGENPKLAWYRDERWNTANRIMSGYRRVKGLTTSRDGVHWENHQQIFTPDDWDYGETQFQWGMMFKRGDLYLTHLSIHHDDIDRTCGWTALATSRDLYHWTRHRDMFLRYGEEPTDGDKWIIAWGNQQLFIQDDYMYLGFFVQGSHKPPRRKFETVARLPLDRFVSRDSIRDKRGILQTPLVRFASDVEQLSLNARVAERGEIRVQLRDSDGNVVRGYSFDDSVPIKGNALRHPVQWKSANGSLGKEMGGRDVQLEVSLQRASLFAFYLTSSTWQQDVDTRVVKNWPSPDTYDIHELLDMASPDRPTVSTGDSSLVVAPPQFEFKVLKGRGMAYSGESPVQSLSIATASPDKEWKIDVNIPWLVVTPASGKGKAQVQVQAVGQSMRPGRFLGKIKISSPDNAAEAVEIAIVFELVLVDD